MNRAHEEVWPEDTYVCVCVPQRVVLVIIKARGINKVV